MHSGVDNDMKSAMKQLQWFTMQQRISGDGMKQMKTVVITGIRNTVVASPTQSCYQIRQYSKTAIKPADVHCTTSTAFYQASNNNNNNNEAFL